MLAPEVNTRPDRWPPFGFGDVGTYRRSIYLLADLVVGPTLFALGTSLLLLSAGFAVTLVGIPLLVVTLGLARAAGRFERARAASLLGVVVLPPPMVRGLRARVTDGAVSDAVHDGLLARNPCSRRTSPGAGGQRPYVASTEQMWALHDAIAEHLRPAILLGAFVGLRTAEVVGLRVERVDFTRGVVRPVQQRAGEPLKSDTARTRCRGSVGRRLRGDRRDRPADLDLGDPTSGPHGSTQGRRVAGGLSGSTTFATTWRHC
jgi:integrase